MEIDRVVYNYFVISKFRNRIVMNYALTELKEQLRAVNNYHSMMLQMVSPKAAGALSSLEELKKRGHKAGDLQILESLKIEVFCWHYLCHIEKLRLWSSRVETMKQEQTHA